MRKDIFKGGGILIYKFYRKTAAVFIAITAIIMASVFVFNQFLPEKFCLSGSELKYASSFGKIITFERDSEKAKEVLQTLFENQGTTETIYFNREVKLEDAKKFDNYLKLELIFWGDYDMSNEITILTNDFIKANARKGSR